MANIDDEIELGHLKSKPYQISSSMYVITFLNWYICHFLKNYCANICTCVQSFFILENNYAYGFSKLHLL